MRRLYDIADVLVSLGLISKIHLTQNRKPAFLWAGCGAVYPLTTTVQPRAYTRDALVTQVRALCSDDAMDIASLPAAALSGAAVNQFMMPFTSIDPTLFMQIMQSTFMGQTASTAIGPTHALGAWMSGLGGMSGTGTGAHAMAHFATPPMHQRAVTSTRPTPAHSTTSALSAADVLDVASSASALLDASSARFNAAMACRAETAQQ